MNAEAFLRDRGVQYYTVGDELFFDCPFCGDTKKRFGTARSVRNTKVRFRLATGRANRQMSMVERAIRLVRVALRWGLFIAAPNRGDFSLSRKSTSPFDIEEEAI